MLDKNFEQDKVILLVPSAFPDSFKGSQNINKYGRYPVDFLAFEVHLAFGIRSS